VLDDAIKADSRNAPALELKGKLLLGEKKYKEAISCFLQLEKTNPERALPLLVGAYEMAKDSSKAQQVAERIVAGSPKSAHGYLILASVFTRRNDLDRAVDTLNKGLAAEGENVQVHMALGKLYERKRLYPKALEAYGEVLRLNPKNIPAAFAEGTVYEQMGNRSEAIRKYRDVLAKSDTYVPALNNLAYLYCNGDAKQRREALRLAARAYRLVPNNPSIMDTYGYALVKNGMNKEARPILEKAAVLLPGNPSIHYHLALAYKDLNDRQMAIKSLKQALKLGPFPDADSARTMLNELQR